MTRRLEPAAVGSWNANGWRVFAGHSQDGLENGPLIGMLGETRQIHTFGGRGRSAVSDSLDPLGQPMGSFPTTRWSLVLGARDRSRLEARAALAELCQEYWYPIYAFIRRKGHDHHDAEDVTQAYFARLLENDVIAAADRCKGRFRTFLRTDCQHFLIDQYRRRTARGGAVRPISIDLRDAEGRYRIEPADHMTPDLIFDRAWAMTLLDRVLERLAAEFAAKGRSEVFEHLKIALTQGKGAVPAAALAARLGMTEDAVNVAIHRVRKRYREILVEHIAETLDDVSQLDDEIRSLFAALRS
jgi:RNA polymerase sigma-70 factor (ECF subfamily)